MNYALQLKHPLALIACCLLLGALTSVFTILLIASCLLGFVLCNVIGTRAAIVSFCSLALGQFSMHTKLTEYNRIQRLLQSADQILIEIGDNRKGSNKAPDFVILRAIHTPRGWTNHVNFKLKGNDLPNSISYISGNIFLLHQAKLRVPAKSQFPFEFNAIHYHYGLNCLGTIQVSKSRVFAFKSNPSIWIYVSKFRGFLLDKIKRNVKPDTWFWYQGLILGDKSEINNDDKALFQQAGLMHVLSVSGMHLGLIYWLLSWPIKKLSIRFKHLEKLELSLLPPIWFYAFLTGMAPPVFRAVVFITLFLILKTLYSRRVRLSDLLMSALCLQIIIDPLTLYSVSFQLSFAAMLGIAFLFPVWQDYWMTRLSKGNALMDLIGMSCCCTLSTLPLTLYHFHAIPTWFLMGNVLFTFPFTLLIYAFVAYTFVASVPLFSIVVPISSMLLDLGVELLQRMLTMFESFPLPFLYAYDFRLVDFVIWVFFLLWYWRDLSLNKRIPARAMRILMLVWLIYSANRTSELVFSREVDSRRVINRERLKTFMLWENSQGRDTVFIKTSNQKSW